VKLVFCSIAVSFLLCGLTGNSANARSAPTVPQIICQVFGSYCSTAQCIAYRESRYQTWAQNGQYLGIFQMGSHERALFGHGNDAWSQARAAKRYFDYERAHGRSGWGPWGGYCS
jgi:hypothetical protein